MIVLTNYDGDCVLVNPKAIEMVEPDGSNTKISFNKSITHVNESVEEILKLIDMGNKDFRQNNNQKEGK